MPDQDFDALAAAGIGNDDELMSIYGTPGESIVRKVSSRVNEGTATFIAASPLIFLSTHSEEGRCDVTPRGGAPGFVKILGDSLVAIPDVPGNRRLDSMNNILKTGRAGLFFAIPGRTDGIRLNGRACVTTDQDILDKFDVESKQPRVAIVIEVEELFVHCSTAFARSKAWDQDARPDASAVPTMNQLWKSHLRDNGVGL